MCVTTLQMTVCRIVVAEARNCANDNNLLQHIQDHLQQRAV